MGPLAVTYALMTNDSDMYRDLNQLRYEREMATFKHVYLVVQGTDEKSCDEELRTQLAKFTDAPEEWTVGSANYSRREVSMGMDGETKISVWELEATLARRTGFVPWSGLE